MKYIRSLVVIMFILSLAGYAVLRYQHEVNLDETAPVISCDSEAIEVSVEDPDEKLMEGVTASDDRDGDLTKQVIVENIGPFMSDKSRTITYVVCDSSNNTGRASRTLTYSDYEPPRFSLSQQLRFPAGTKIDVLEYLHAKDSLDGDLTSQIRLTYGYIPYQPGAGNYELGYQVSNSAGDVSAIELNVEIYEPDDASYVPVVNLSDYVVYIGKGKLFNPYQYIDSVTISSREFEISTSSAETSAEEGEKVKGMFGDLSNKDEDDEVIDHLFYNDIYVDNQVNVKKPGVYTVKYTVITQDGYTGTAALSVIVYE
ncbi:MAG: DUF5011 domain-containing protein [Lachnospiraceae bacterium]|nr:DUF5011 domain-containing protein [Lachnospiraceae bacterium]